MRRAKANLRYPLVFNCSRPIANIGPDNCKTKNLNCRYGLNITFVEPKETSAKNHPRSRLRKYANVQFVDDAQSSGVSSKELGAEPAKDGTTAEFNALSSSRALRDAPSTYHDSHKFPRAKPNDSKDSMTTCQIPHQPYQVPANTATNTSPQESISDRHPSSFDCHPMDRMGKHCKDNPPLRRTVTSATLLSEEHQINLLTHYRYFVAPAIDLGLGTLYFGIRGLNRSLASADTQSVILSLARLHQSAKARKSSEEYSEEANNVLRQAALDDDALLEHRLTYACLLAWRNVLALPMERWNLAINAVPCPEVYDPNEFPDHQFVLSQLSLAAALTASEKPGDLRFRLQSDPKSIDRGQKGSTSYLHQSLYLLSRAYDLTVNVEIQRSQRETPFSTRWQSCWDDTQQWYASRPEDMQQIFELAELDSYHDQSTPVSALALSTIIMTSVCAAVANIMYHLTAVLLLQRKPRLVKPHGLINLSSSTSWHVQRIIGLAASTDESEIWAPIVIAAVIEAAKRLSHNGQLRRVIELLQKASMQTGMRLEGEMKKLEEARSVATR